MTDNTLLILYRMSRYLPDVCMHFVSSAVVGWLAWRWTWIISWALLWLLFGPASRHWTPTLWSPGSLVGRYIWRLSWAAALFCSLALHVSQDWFVWLW